MSLLKIAVLTRIGESCCVVEITNMKKVDNIKMEDAESLLLTYRYAKVYAFNDTDVEYSLWIKGLNAEILQQQEARTSSSTVRAPGS